MRALLDVNVLIALLDADHLHHVRARDWLGANIATGWASCPITQNGCIRILSQPNYPNALKPSQVAERLREATEAVYHQFWAESPSLLTPSLVNWEYIVGSRQVTDAYLLALAVHHDGRLVTFDHAIARRVVPGADERHLAVL
ncbi:MAG TPA: TA system VapC family ribonuclease toxin [Steroidobacteraceae bacterium]